MVDTASLSDKEKRRYARQILLPEIGIEGQKRLKAAKVLVIGAGGLGSPIALYLASAGIGTLGLVEEDQVDLSTLQRQILYDTKDQGRLKVEAARERLQNLNPETRIDIYPTKITPDNARTLMDAYDIVVDGTDNFAAHYLINDACILANKPLVYGNVHRFAGQVASILPGKTACYRCLYPAPPPPELAPSCAEAGVLGVVPGMIGLMQATEILKLILGIGTGLGGRILRFDALSATIKEMEIARDPACAVCGDAPTVTKLSCVGVPPTCGIADEITAQEFKRLMTSYAPPFVLDVRNPYEYEMERVEGAVLIPLAELANRWGELNPADRIVIYCKAGIRSLHALEILRAKGFTKIQSLAGGIDGL